MNLGGADLGIAPEDPGWFAVVHSSLWIWDGSASKAVHSRTSVSLGSRVGSGRCV